MELLLQIVICAHSSIGCKHETSFLRLCGQKVGFDTTH